MKELKITEYNISNYIGDLQFGPGDLPFDLWEVFDKKIFDSLSNKDILPIDQIVSCKNQMLDPKFLSGEKKDPRQTAFDWMLLAAKGETKKRAPIRVVPCADGKYRVDDGNATVQVLMIVKWNQVPAEIHQEEIK